jgi:hypothetical protein
VPPLGLFFSGVFTFPFRLKSLSEFLTLALGAVALVAAIRLALWCNGADREGIDRFTRMSLWNGLLLSVAFGGIVLPLWTCLASAYGLAILRDTSYGGEAVEDWPNVLALEGLGEWMYVLSGLLLAALPGVLAAPLWNWLGISRALAVALTVPVLFPVLLLSMLETDSPANPFSPSVWKSVWYGWLAWAEFYVVTLATAALGAAFLIYLRRRGGWATEAVATGVVVTAAWMIYCRLLGRLASFCSGRGAT